jgi:hypothetical protein
MIATMVRNESGEDDGGQFDQLHLTGSRVWTVHRRRHRAYFVKGGTAIGRRARVRDSSQRR